MIGTVYTLVFTCPWYVPCIRVPMQSLKLMLTYPLQSLGYHPVVGCEPMGCIKGSHGLFALLQVVSCIR